MKKLGKMPSTFAFSSSLCFDLTKGPAPSSRQLMVDSNFLPGSQLRQSGRIAKTQTQPFKCSEGCIGRKGSSRAIAVCVRLLPSVETERDGGASWRRSMFYALEVLSPVLPDTLPQTHTWSWEGCLSLGGLDFMCRCLSFSYLQAPHRKDGAPAARRACTWCSRTAAVTLITAPSDSVFAHMFELSFIKAFKKVT